MKLTWADQLRKEGAQEALLHLLGVRFGPLSDDVKRRVEGISSMERLNTIVEQALAAHSLEEIGLR